MEENNKSIYIKTDIGKDKYLNVNINQDFDFLKILSLNILQEDIFGNSNSQIGIVCGRVNCNEKLGISNVKISLFIPINDNDSETLTSTIYPYKNTTDTDSNGIRYNLLTPNTNCNEGEGVGNFPTKRQFLDNNVFCLLYTSPSPRD